jgi:hypothetical protein
MFHGCIWLLRAGVWLDKRQTGKGQTKKVQGPSGKSFSAVDGGVRVSDRTIRSSAILGRGKWSNRIRIILYRRCPGRVWPHFRIEPYLNCICAQTRRFQPFVLSMIAAGRSKSAHRLPRDRLFYIIRFNEKC